MKPLFGGLLVRLLASVILPFSLVLFGLAVAAIDIHGKAMRQLVAERDERSAGAAAAAVSQELYHRQVTLRQIALRLGDGVPASRAIAEADVAARDFSEGLAALKSDGTSVAGSIPKSASGSPALRQALASPGSDRPYIPLATKGGTIVLTVSRGGSFTVVGAFAISDLLRLALPGLEASPGRVSAIIVDQSSDPISTYGAPPLELDYSNHPGVRAALQGSSGSSFTMSAAGEEHVLAYSPIAAAGWALLIEEPWRSVASPLLRLSLVAPLALVPALAIALLGLWLAGRQVVLPLRELQRNSLKLAGGDFTAVDGDVGGVQEIQELQRSMRIMARRLQSAQQSLRRYIGKVTTAQEEERRRIAQDLHDETIQDLIALDQKVQLAGRNLRARMGVRAAGLDDIHREAKDAIQRVRRLTRALRPAYLEDLGLLAALEALAEDVESSMHIPILVRSEGTTAPLSNEADLALYRIVQEALANISRHAAARRAWVTLRYRRGGILVTVRDDGVGFRLPQEAGDLSRTGHFGLIGMRERAQLVGARLEIHSSPGKGTRVTLRLPFSP